MWWVKAKDAAKHPPVGDDPCNKESSSPNVNRPELSQATDNKRQYLGGTSEAKLIGFHS